MIELYDEALGLRVRAERLGGDVLVTLTGGDAPHIGAVAVGEPHPSLSGDGTPSASVSVYCGLGHRDAEPAQKIAKALSKALKCRSVAVVGIHYDAFLPQTAAELYTYLEDLCRTLPDLLRQDPGEGRRPSERHAQ